jgi:hypothetical protein
MRHPSLPTDTLRAVEIHYYRVPPERWELMLLRARQSGANAVSSYIPWLHHEPVDGLVDLDGRTHPGRDLVGFVERCRRAGLGFIAKPGPFCDAEMLGGGVPTWLIDAHPEWWAKGFHGRTMRHSDSNDARLSYDSPEVQARAAQWLRAVAVALEPFVGDTLWAWQIDNETPGDGMLVHEDDRSPTPVRADVADVGRWQAWLVAQYGTIDALNTAWGSGHGSFAEVTFPTAWDAPGDTLAARRWLDLDDFADAQMASGLATSAAAVDEVLAGRVALFHDLLCMPWQLAGMMIDPGVLADTCTWVGQNVYAEDVDPDDMIAGTEWYQMNDVEYVHHAWWRTRLCESLSPEGMPHLVPEVSARQAFYLQCSLAGGMDAPCIYMLHSSDPEPVAIGAFQRWAEEAPVLPDGTVMAWWWNLRTLFACLAHGGADLAAAPVQQPVVIAWDHAGERLARYGGVIAGGGLAPSSELAALADRANTSAAGMRIGAVLLDAGVEFGVIDATRSEAPADALVVVPDVAVMSRAAQQRLAAVAAERPGSVMLAGEAPSLDEHLQPFALLADLPPWDAPAAGPHVGVDVAVRVGASGTRYVTVVNRTAAPWTGSADGVAATVNAASVCWFAHYGGEVNAALLHGRDARAGSLASGHGQVAVTRTGDAWHVLAEERSEVTVPAAAGLSLWRVTLAGDVIECGPVPASGRFEVVRLDDRGETDRFVLGPRELADAVAAAVTHFRLTTLADVQVECERLGVEPGEVVHRARRLRSARAAGREVDTDLLDALTRLTVRMGDLRLGMS